MMERVSAIFNSDDYHKVLSLLLLFAFVVIFTGIGLRYPWPADEPRFAEVAKEMVISGQWFFPTRGGELYPDKPPVFMWAIALVYWLTGNMKVSFLLPNALLSLVTLWCVYDLAARLWNVRVARNAFLLLMLAPQFVLQAKTAQIDAMVAAWITLAMYGLIRHYFIRASWGWYCLSWCFMGLGVITKGVGFLPLLFLLPVWIVRYRQQNFSLGILARELIVGFACMLLVIGLWALPMIYMAEHSHNADFIAYRNNILFKQTGERYANSWGHIKPWYFFLLSVIPVLWFPLPYMLISRQFWQQEGRKSLIACLLCWVLLVVIFFSLSPGKRGVYILPALPMLALALAPWVTKATLARWLHSLLVVAMWGFNGLLYLVAGLLIFKLPALLRHIELQDNLSLFIALMLIAAVVTTLVLIVMKNKPVLCRLGVMLSCIWLIYSTIGFIALKPIRSPAKGIMQRVATEIGPHGELGVVDFKEQFLLFSPLPITQFSYLSSSDEQYRNAWLWMKQASSRYILAPDRKEYIACFDVSQAKLMGTGHRKSWLLFDASSMAADCLPPQQIRQYHMPFSQKDVVR